MQHGSARPCAVKYISDHGRRHADQGCASPVRRLRLNPGSVAPEASSVTPSSAPIASAASIAACSSRRVCSNSEDSGARHAEARLVEHQALQVHRAHAHPCREPDELGQAAAPSRCRPVSQSETRGRSAPVCALVFGQAPDVAHDAREEILAAHLLVARGIGGIERDAQLVEAGRDQAAETSSALSSVPLVLNST